MRLVLEEVFRPPRPGETEPVKLGEVVIYTEDLTPDQMVVCKSWPKKYKAILKEKGIDIE